ncbi:tape measure domain-containing protein, partial [Calidifontimicrobium sp. SYSU G02091]|nr:tape measure domain-containing protein [Calidifontimicrobium sp. SYSU G02091]
EASLQDRLVSVGEYYARKTALEQQGIDAEIARQRQLLVAQNVITRDPKSSESERIRARGEVQRIEAELIVLNNRRADVERANAREAARAERELADALEDARLKLAQITGTETDADRRAAIERSYRDLKARLAAEGQDSSLIDRLIDVESASRNLDALQARWRQALDAMRQAQDNANVMRDAGVLTQAQAQQRITQAAAEAKEAMEQLLPALEAAMQRLFPPDEVSRRMQALRAEILKTQPVVENLGTKIAGQVQDAFAAMFEQIGAGAKTARDAFLDFARSVIAAINRIAAQKLAEVLFGGGKGGFDLAALVSSGLKAIGFASGGYVSGPGTSTSDSIPARLSAGEYVVRAEAVRRFGVAFLDAINGLRVPPTWSGARLAFAAGGVVPQVPARDGGSSAVRIVNVIDPAMAADYLNSSAGERVVLNVLSRNAGAVRQILM